MAKTMASQRSHTNFTKINYEGTLKICFDPPDRDRKLKTDLFLICLSVSCRKAFL